MRTRLASTLIGATLIVLAGNPAGAAESTAKGAKTDAPEEPANNWLVTCNNQADPARLACQIGQNIVERKSGQRVAALQIAQVNDGRVLQLVLPFGIRIKDSVELLIDGRSYAKIALTTADAAGLFAELPYAAELESLMKSGETLTLRVVNLAGSRLDIEMTLKGFGRAYALFGTVAK